MNSLELHKLFENSILYICKDSKIKLKIDNKYYNLEDFSESININKLFMCLNSSKILLEKGVTVGNIVNALNIFSDNITLLTGKDFNSYYKLNNLITSHDGHLFDTIFFSRSLIYTDSHKEKPVIKIRNNEPRSLFHVEYRLDAFGKDKSNNEQYSALCPISKIKNVPVKILDETSVFINAYTGDIEKKKEDDKSSKRQHIHKNVKKENEILFFDFIKTLFNYVFFYESASTLKDHEDKINELDRRLDEFYKIDNNKKDNIVPINDNVKINENKDIDVQVSKEFSSDMAYMLNILKEDERNRVKIFKKIIKENNIIPNISRLDIEEM